MEFNPFPDLLNTGFTVIEIGLFYGVETWKQKYANSKLFSDNMAMFLRPTTKILQILVEFL